MPETFSTLEREMEGGRVYSSRRGRAALLSAVPATPAAPAVAAPAAAAPDQPRAGAFTGTWAGSWAAPAGPKGFRFALSADGIPAAFQLTQGSQGSVDLALRPDGSYEVTGALTGLGPITDPGVQPTLWLIHDLKVPEDLLPADREMLPRAADSSGNAPGSIFTLDGKPPTYAATPNTLAIAVSPGTFVQSPDGAWQLRGALRPETNQAYHPMVVLGPATLPDMNEPMASGTVARLLTDLFMRPATVHPELNLRTQYMQRLAAIGRELRESGFRSYLDGDLYTRAAVTLEGIVRATPRLMPTRETCLAVAHSRDD